MTEKSAAEGPQFERIRALPALSSVIAELIVSIDDEDVSLTRLVRLIERDQAIVSQTLRLANSPFFGMRGKIGTVRDALTVIGFCGLRSMVLASELRQRLAINPVHGFETDAFWNHAYETAVAARALCKGSPALADKAFLAGLLHDLGKIACLSLTPEDAAAIIAYSKREHCDWSQAETALGLPTHTELGAALARHWHFPETLSQAIASHHPPVRHDQTLTLIVHVADILACAMAFVVDGESMIAPIDPMAWRELAADPEELSRATHAIREVQIRGGRNPEASRRSDA
ncbi:HDOD domain-containing protein [Niveibacterium terrae]|uniref:HDOD domain-containing protein n=1 Tax=Niveibacterium terrae TaxID=3373598 RepID=UPI003A94B2F6